MNTVYVVANLAECRVLHSGSFLKCWEFLRGVQSIAYKNGIVILKYADWLRIREGVSK